MKNMYGVKVQGKSRTRGETLVRTNLGGKTSLVPCFVLVDYFHPGFFLNLVPSYGKLGTRTPSLGYFMDTFNIMITSPCLRNYYVYIPSQRFKFFLELHVFASH
jgi:hypothetical protein